VYRSTLRLLNLQFGEFFGIFEAAYKMFCLICLLMLTKTTAELHVSRNAHYEKKTNLIDLLYFIVCIIGFCQRCWSKRTDKSVREEEKIKKLSFAS
jgi:hypothetical protein